MKNGAKEAEFQNLFGKLTAGQQDSVLSMERKFTLAAQLHPDNTPSAADRRSNGQILAEVVQKR